MLLTTAATARRMAEDTKRCGKLRDQPACRGNGPALPSDIGGHQGRLAARSSQLW